MRITIGKKKKKAMMIALIGRRSATSEKGKRNDERTGE